MTWPLTVLEGGLKVSADSTERRNLLGLGRMAIESSDPVRCRLREFRVETPVKALISGENMIAKSTCLFDEDHQDPEEL